MYVLDGGHRLRTIVSFKANKFPIQVQHPENHKRSDGTPIPQFVYYDNIHRRSSTRSNAARVLTDQERKIFDKYSINIVNYPSSTELEARKLFNILNHHRAMTSAEVVNSIGTFLIGFIRQESAQIMDTGITVCENLKNMSGPSFKKVEHHKDILSLLAIWNVVNPEGTNVSELEENSLANCKTSLASGVESFVRKLDRELEESECIRFREMLDNMFKIDTEFSEHKLTAAYLLAALHFMRFNNISADEFIEMSGVFNQQRREWQRLFSEKDKENKRRQPNQERLQLLTTQMNDLDTHFWFTKYYKSYKVDGLNKKGMKARKEIFEQVHDDFNGIPKQEWRHIDAQQQSTV
jgi:hypothetical protein